MQASSEHRGVKIIKKQKKQKRSENDASFFIVHKKPTHEVNTMNVTL